MKNIFHELIKKSGLTLCSKNSKVNILDCDQAVFQKNLRSALVLCPKLEREETISRFVGDLEIYLDDEKNLKPSLLFSQTSQNCPSFRGGQQDSLVRLLLNIDELQPKIISFLTEKLLQLAYESNEDLKLDLCRLILANLRWLDHIVNSSSLNEKIIEILQGSPVQIQKEIICFLPNIIDDESHSEISKILCDLYKSTPELTSSILDALSYLTLDVTVLSDIHNVVLERLHTVKPENLTLVVKFLLSNAPSNGINKVIAKIREKIILPCTECSRPIGFSSGISSSKAKSKSKENNEDYELLLFSTIKTSSLLDKHLGTAWLKAVNDLSDRNSVKHFDFLILLVLYQYIPFRRKGIESSIRNLIRLQILKPSYIESIFRNHSLVIKENFDAVKMLCDVLLRSSEIEVSRFGSNLYRYSFASLGVFHQQEVILCLLSHLGDNECVRQNSLSLLSLLAYNYPVMSNYVAYIKGSLDILETLSLREAKILMDFLLHLVNSNEAEASKDELSILIKKQLFHPDIKFKRLGVVGAVLTLKITMGINDSENHDSSSHIETNLKESEALFNAVKESTTNYPCSSALFMDELATNILKNGLNQKLEKWISEKVIGDFEETFITDCETEVEEDNYICPVSFQWNLDDLTESEKSKSIAVCIAKLVTEDLEHSDQEHSSKIVTLAPHFRLMRMVESHLYAGDLGNIDALLGCGIQMPTPDTYDKFSSLSEKEQTFALTCLFYAINWFRELINAFATQKDKDLKKKVVLRLRKMLSLQGLLVKVLKDKPSFQPPPATFDLDSEYKIEIPVVGESKGKTKETKEKKKGRKRKLNDEKVGNSQTQNALATQAGKSNSSAKDTHNLNVKACKAFLRELHLDVFNLLFKKLCLDDELDQDSDSYLFVKEADFLISDLNEKFGRAFESGAKRTCVLKSQSQKDIGFAHFDVFTAPEVAEQALRYIKPICAHLESICIFFQKIIPEDEEDMEAEDLDNSERTLPIVNLYTSLFMSLRLFLSWPSLQLLEHSTLVKNCFKLFAKKIETNCDEMSNVELVSTSFKYLSKFCDSIVNIETAVELVQLLDVLISFSTSGKLKEQLGKIIIKFLKRNWTTADGNDTKGALFSSNLRELLKIFFCCSADPISDAYSITNDGIKELCESSSSKNPVSNEYPTLKKSTLPVYYSALSKNLVFGTKKMLLSKSSNNYEMLELWSVSVKILHALTESLRKFETNSMFSSCLQNSKEYLNLFLQEGMPLFEKCFKKHQKEVTALLKNLQLTTRFLHNLCTVVKTKKDSSAVRYVPSVKCSLETLVFRVKAMLTLYNCQTAFWLGNLKNRDLQGKELLSQSQSTENEESENEEVSDEGLSDVDIEDNVDGDSKKVDSYSVVY